MQRSDGRFSMKLSSSGGVGELRDCFVGSSVLHTRQCAGIFGQGLWQHVDSQASLLNGERHLSRCIAFEKSVIVECAVSVPIRVWLIVRKKVKCRIGSMQPA